MVEIIRWLRENLEGVAAGETIGFEVLDPDCAKGVYAGEIVSVEGEKFCYRGYKAWTDLAELLFCRMLTPEKRGDATVRLRFEKLDLTDSFHRSGDVEKAEKYGVDSPFFAINKSEEPAFLAAHIQALESVKIGSRKRVLNLGVNTGDEFELIKTVAGEQFEEISLVGIDHSSSAIAYAKERFPQTNVEFYAHDINKLDDLALGRFDLIVSIGTLQSPGIEFKPLFMSLVQNYLEPNGSVILGFPNCRWMGGEMIYGAKAPNYAHSEQSLLYKDVHFCKKYLQQKKFRVTLTGKPYLFLTATPIGVKKTN
ncbi:MAG: methyltransferase domain-containing protein [Campylobacterota bacterium]|nr:methyltransferase domain-containing protein [Campylobacterota bacterium]